MTTTQQRPEADQAPRICRKCWKSFTLAPDAPPGRKRTACYVCSPVHSAKAPPPSMEVECGYCRLIFTRKRGKRAFCSDRCNLMAMVDWWWKEVEIATYGGGPAMERAYARNKGEAVVPAFMTDEEIANRWAKLGVGGWVVYEPADD